jgi:hypothetical protein
MAARWYNPAAGQFVEQDTQAQNPVPTSAEANPFAFVDDNPVIGKATSPRDCAQPPTATATPTSPTYGPGKPPS